MSVNIHSQDYGEWKIIDSLNIQRTGHSATIMPDGNVLVAGGWKDTSALSSCEIYNPETDEWLRAPSMNLKRHNHGMITLNDGRIFVFGGEKVKDCEIYDPTTQKRKTTDSLKAIRQAIYSNSIAHLLDNRVLVTGGHRNYPPILLSSCELYDPVLEEWQTTDSLKYSRWAHTATTLKNGKVLVVGGFGNEKELNKCELYDPLKNEWEIVDTLNVARSNHSAILLHGGKVLVIGGQNYGNPTSPWLSCCEIYDPLKNEWTQVGFTNYAHSDHAAYIINNSNVLIVDTYYEIYNVSTNSSVYLGEYPVDKGNMTVVQLPDGRVIGIGGMEIFGDTTPFVMETDKCEMFDPMPTYIDENYENPPTDFVLYPNYPNPFNPSTTITFSLPQQEKVELIIYDILGCKVAELVKKTMEAGKYNIDFDGSKLSSGMYIYKITAGSFTKSKKMLLLK